MVAKVKRGSDFDHEEIAGSDKTIDKWYNDKTIVSSLWWLHDSAFVKTQNCTPKVDFKILF